MDSNHDTFHWNEHQLAQLVRSIPMFVVPPARSRSICAVGYDADANILALQMRGHEDMIHAFINVPASELEALLTSASMRQHLNGFIRARYRCVAVTREDEDTPLTFFSRPRPQPSQETARR